MRMELKPERIETDMLVIGGAGAGLRAAIEGLSEGVEVTLISKTPAAAESTTYRTAGFITRSDDESADELFRRILYVGGYINDQRLVERFVAEAPGRVRELERFGVKLEPLGPQIPGQPGHFRIVRDVGTCGSAMMNPLRRAFEERGGVVMDGFTASDLLFDRTGRLICGALAFSEEGTPYLISAGSVLIATGGGAAIFARTDNPPGTTGDGIAMAYRAGAQLINLECISFNLSRDKMNKLFELGKPDPEMLNRGSAHYFLGGIRIDPDGSTTLPGLFAAGETTGGLFGAGRLGGSAMADILIFGTVAGRSAARFARSSGRLKVNEDQLRSLISEVSGALSSSGPSAVEVNSELRSLLWQHVGLAKTKRTLKEGAEKLERITGKVKKMRCSPGEMRLWVETRNIHLLGKLIARASLHREETRGNFWRLDHPNPDNSRWLKNIILVDRDGRDELMEEPIRTTRAIQVEVPPIGAGCF
jgi:succinate dehydrogenase/fumarate reductase flavoprotein subunit